MKIDKQLTIYVDGQSSNVDVDIQVEVTAEDIAAAIHEIEEGDPEGIFLRMLVNAAQFMQSVPDEAIAKMKPEPRKRIAEIFAEQAKRYVVPDDTGVIDG